MWKTLSILLLLFCFFSTSAEKNNHLNELNSAFPFALLTYDFGILTIDDLKINSCIAQPSSFEKNNKPTNPYPYWQCFEVKKSKMICEGRKYDPDSKSRVSMLVLSGERDGEVHEFISRRTMPVTSCQLYQKDWQKFTKNEDFVCISGSMPSKKIKNDKILWNWIFGRYKTKKGCDSYFAEECNLQSQIKNGQCAG